jgi:hypothetical protein
MAELAPAEALPQTKTGNKRRSAPTGDGGGSVAPVCSPWCRPISAI